ncbi:MAG: hypothetical protein U9N08_01835, partial [Candidatus Caldatribacteriota bacterium]|nr:hypothetical protein [Candidatus Caldatribacteriota bacterium]
MGVKERNIREGFSLSESGSLTFDHFDLKEISQKYGTPCYVYSENLIRKKCREYTQAFSKNNVEFEILYASKAFLVKAMAHILNDEGLSLDIASGGELYIALSANFP